MAHQHHFLITENMIQRAKTVKVKMDKADLLMEFISSSVAESHVRHIMQFGGSKRSQLFLDPHQRVFKPAGLSELGKLSATNYIK